MPKMTVDRPSEEFSFNAISPGLQSANLSAKLLRELGADTTIGPILVGMERPLQVASMTASASDLVTLAVLAASGIVR